MTAPAAETTGAQVPAPSAPKSFAEIMQTIRARAQGEPPRDQPLPPKPAPVAPVTAEIKGDDAALKRVSKLEADNLAARERITQLEGAEKDANTLREVKRLYGGGKRMDAIALLAGADPTGEMEALLADYLAQDGPEPGTEAALAKAVDAKLDEMNKRVASVEEAATKLRTEEQARATAAENAARLSFAVSALEGAKKNDGSPQFELCSRPENRADLEARLFGRVDEQGVEQPGWVQRLAIEQAVKSEDVTPDLARKLIIEGYAKIEAELEAEGQKAYDAYIARFGRPEPARAPQNAPVVAPAGNSVAPERQREPQPRPMPRPPVVREANNTPAWSLDAVLAKNRERARY